MPEPLLFVMTKRVIPLTAPTTTTREITAVAPRTASFFRRSLFCLRSLLSLRISRKYSSRSSSVMASSCLSLSSLFFSLCIFLFPLPRSSIVTPVHYFSVIFNIPNTKSFIPASQQSGNFTVHSLPGSLVKVPCNLHSIMVFFVFYQHILWNITYEHLPKFVELCHFVYYNFLSV